VPGNRCWLYYNQPRRFPNYLAVMSIVSARDTTLATVRRVLQTLDEIAAIKGVDALLCDAANWRLSTAIMCRWGWEPHCPSYWHRHFIRRFPAEIPIADGKATPQQQLAGV
jgi:2-keto-3-deoxy-L-rhamnonate aldolase RhmA